MIRLPTIYRTAMKGTTNSVKDAILVSPPINIKAAMAAAIIPPTSGGI